MKLTRRNLIRIAAGSGVKWKRTWIDCFEPEQA